MIRMLELFLDCRNDDLLKLNSKKLNYRTFSISSNDLAIV